MRQIWIIPLNKPYPFRQGCENPQNSLFQPGNSFLSLCLENCLMDPQDSGDIFLCHRTSFCLLQSPFSYWGLSQVFRQWNNNKKAQIIITQSHLWKHSWPHGPTGCAAALEHAIRCSLFSAKLHQSRTKFSEGRAKLFFFPMAHRDKAQISKLLRVLQDEKRPCDHILLSSVIFP